MDSERQDSVRRMLAVDPGNSVFEEFAEFLRSTKAYSEALSVCLAGLSANPAAHRGRLILARVFYEQGFMPFAARELAVLHHELPQNRAIKKLLSELAPEYVAEMQASGFQAKSGAETTVAETELDFDILATLGTDREK